MCSLRVFLFLGSLLSSLALTTRDASAYERSIESIRYSQEIHSSILSLSSQDIPFNQKVFDYDYAGYSYFDETLKRLYLEGQIPAHLTISPIISTNAAFRAAGSAALYLEEENLIDLIQAGDSIVLSDTVTSHCATLYEIDRIGEKAHFIDQRPDESFLLAGRNVAGIRGVVERSEGVEYNTISITFDELRRVLRGAFVPMTSHDIAQFIDDSENRAAAIDIASRGRQGAFLTKIREAFNDVDLLQAEPDVVASFLVAFDRIRVDYARGHRALSPNERDYILSSLDRLALFPDRSRLLSEINRSYVYEVFYLSFDRYPQATETALTLAEELLRRDSDDAYAIVYRNLGAVRLGGKISNDELLEGVIAAREVLFAIDQSDRRNPVWALQQARVGSATISRFYQTLWVSYIVYIEALYSGEFSENAMIMARQMHHDFRDDPLPLFYFARLAVDNQSCEWRDEIITGLERLTVLFEDDEEVKAESVVVRSLVENQC